MPSTPGGGNLFPPLQFQSLQLGAGGGLFNGHQANLFSNAPPPNSDFQSNNLNPNTLLSLAKITNGLKHFNQTIFQIPNNATCTVYVEGLPWDTNDREVSRKFLFLFLINIL